MFGQKKPNKPIKFRKLKDFYIHKGEKTKFGGKGIGGVYRDKKTGKDYLIKRIDTSDVMWYRNVKAQQKENWRSWDEILAAKFLKAAGVLVPNMFAVEDENGLVYVACIPVVTVRCLLFAVLFRFAVFFVCYFVLEAQEFSY